MSGELRPPTVWGGDGRPLRVNRDLPGMSGNEAAVRARHALILMMLLEGWSKQAVADHVGVGWATVHRVCSDAWKWRRVAGPLLALRDFAINIERQEGEAP